MTPRMEAVFEFIIAFKKSHDGNSPTVREIAEGCGISSTSVVTYYLGRLEEEGRITRPDLGTACSIEVPGGRWMLENAEAA